MEMESIPVLYPTTEEFENPIEYLSQLKIRRLGKRYGMVKLVPPKEFHPPLSIDVDSFKFIIRLQNLNQLSLVNRNRLFFIKQLNNYNKSINTNTPVFTKPWVSITGNGEKIYLYDIFVNIYKFFNKKIVSPKDEILGNSDLWKFVDLKLGNKGAFVLEKVFKKYMLNYYNYLLQIVKKGPNLELRSQLYSDDQPKSLLEDEDEFKEESTELSSEEQESVDMCPLCSGEADENDMLCSECFNIFHPKCLQANEVDVESENWVCNNCIIGNGYYGFKEDSKLYSLPQFKKLANYKDGVTNADLSSQEVEKIEKEFWNLVNNSEGSFNVRYGADIHNSKPGQITGFPTKGYLPETYTNGAKVDISEYSKYFDHPMNLTNLPNAKGSLLPLLDKSISGMTIPWIYVGSKFSTFCWHLEDQYTLSANYQQEGFPKVWYSIPEDSNENLQNYLNEIAPDMFDKQPDLMHQLVTLVSPYEPAFKKTNIKCYKAIQKPNEYIITFPKCYHAGFNTGYNFNEAVNFTLDLWLKYGVDAVEDYKLTGKTCVFDMNELMFNILSKYAMNNKKMNVKINIGEALARQSYRLTLQTFNENCRLLNMIYPAIIENKIELRKPIIDEEFGTTKSKEEYTICSVCKTICFYSFVLQKTAALTKVSKKRKVDFSSITDWNQETKKKSWKVLCLNDYLTLLGNKLDDTTVNKSFTSSDCLINIRSSDDISDILRSAGSKIDAS